MSPYMMASFSEAPESHKTGLGALLVWSGVFDVASWWGIKLAGARFEVLSLAMASAGFALMLDLVWRRLPAERGLRILAVVLFLGAPLLYGMGASLRWYPLLVLPLALALWSALREERPTLLRASPMKQ